ncbi:acyltransferase family protein [Pontibacter sp. SD6]|uniref:Acyltransferase family protein n=1 Tax=Pontibacter cellulosilyticus TaxID=1720253 RepID=A0A923N5B3_9BACT|nr:acyltransferase family protein [Pontibacter cellulosilyticus]
MAFDIIRCVAVFSVIAVHIASPVSANNILHEFNWWVGNTYQAVFRSGIPLFLMLSGALLLPRATGLSFIGRRVWRIFLPFSFWTAVYLLARNDLATLGFSDYFYELVNSSVNHFWYVYTILVFYLLMPFIRLISKKASFSVSGILVATLLTTFSSMFIPSERPIVVEVIKHVIFAQYLLMGYCLSTNNQDEWWLKNIPMSVALIIIGIGITCFGSYYISKLAPDQSEVFYRSTSLNIFIKALGVWLLIKQTANSITSKALNIISLISKYSFGVYLIHVLVLEHILISWFRISYNNLSPLLGILVLSSITFILSVAILYILDRFLSFKAAY